MRYVKPILWAVLLAVAIMSGILSIAREAIGLFWPDLIPAKGLFWTCARLSFGLSLVALWFREYRNRKSSEDELRAVKKEVKDLYAPSLAGYIVTVNVHAPPAGVPTSFSCSAVIVAEIRNIGADTIVDRYGIFVKKGEEVVVGHLQTFPNTMTLSGAYGTIQYFGTDALYS